MAARFIGEFAVYCRIRGIAARFEPSRQTTQGKSTDMNIPAYPSDITILVVDDEEAVVEVISHTLEEANYKVRKAYDGEEAIAKATPDTNLILLDIMLPKLNGIEVCKKLRSRVATETIPIIFLTAKTDEKDQIQGLMAGGDNYLMKGNNFTESGLFDVILAHVRTALRLSGIRERKFIEIGDLRIYEAEHRAAIGDEDIGLTETEFSLLLYLVRHPLTAFSRKQLLETIWEDAMMVTERTVDAHIKNLREKLDGFARHIQTVRGVGYRFSPTLDENG